MADKPRQRQPARATGIVVLEDGAVFTGRGQGAVGTTAGALHYDTALSGYQEAMTDPASAGQIICFAFPHIGNSGTNDEDMESATAHAAGCILSEPITAASNFRSTQDFDSWLAAHGRIAVSGIDTRALIRRMRRSGAPNIVIAHDPEGVFDIEALTARARAGAETIPAPASTEAHSWTSGPWTLGSGHAEISPATDAPHVVAVDHGVKAEILRQLVAAGARVTLVPAHSSFAEIIALQPDGLFLSGGPGDPAIIAEQAVPLIRQWLETGKPLFGIGLGHQLLALAIGATIARVTSGQISANHPVKQLDNGRVGITTLSNGFTVDRDSLPEGARMTHVSLFDQHLCGLELEGRPVFSVQFQPEASPGPQDSRHLFQRFVEDMQ